MGFAIKIKGFQLPEGIPETGSLTTWVKKQPLPALKKMDRGDPMEPLSAKVRAGDGKLARIEIFNAIVEEYQFITKKSVRAGLKENWQEWEKYQKRRDDLATVIQGLGWNPVFHISDRDYQRRIIQLIRREPPRDVAALQRLFQSGLPSWKEGGLCLGYPEGFKETWNEYTTEETVKACKNHQLTSWGECNGASRKVMALISSALSVYPEKAPEMEWWLIEKLPNTTRGHSFVAIQKKGKRFELDPSLYGFSIKSLAVYLKQDPYRISMATYYSNLALAPGMEEKYAEKEKFFRTAVEINPRYDLGWSGLSWVSMKLGKPKEAQMYSMRAQFEQAQNNLDNQKK